MAWEKSAEELVKIPWAFHFSPIRRAAGHMAATTRPEAPTRSFLADTVRLEYAENTGAFPGLGPEWRPPLRTAIFGIGNGLLLLGLAVIATRRHWQRLALVGVALVVAGGTSNLVDRIAYGVVIDFVNVGVGPVRTGIFNVADVAIMLGTGGLDPFPWTV